MNLLPHALLHLFLIALGTTMLRRFLHDALAIPSLLSSPPTRAAVLAWLFLLLLGVGCTTVGLRGLDYPLTAARAALSSFLHPEHHTVTKPTPAPAPHSTTTDTRTTRAGGGDPGEDHDLPACLRMRGAKRTGMTTRQPELGPGRRSVDPSASASATVEDEAEAGRMVDGDRFDREVERDDMSDPTSLTRNTYALRARSRTPRYLPSPPPRRLVPRGVIEESVEESPYEDLVAMLLSWGLREEQLEAYTEAMREWLHDAVLVPLLHAAGEAHVEVAAACAGLSWSAPLPNLTHGDAAAALAGDRRGRSHRGRGGDHRNERGGDKKGGVGAHGGGGGEGGYGSEYPSGRRVDAPTAGVASGRRRDGGPQDGGRDEHAVTTWDEALELCGDLRNHAWRELQRLDAIPGNHHPHNMFLRGPTGQHQPQAAATTTPGGESAHVHRGKLEDVLAALGQYEGLLHTLRGDATPHILVPPGRDPSEVLPASYIFSRVVGLVRGHQPLTGYQWDGPDAHLRGRGRRGNGYGPGDWASGTPTTTAGGVRPGGDLGAAAAAATTSHSPSYFSPYASTRAAGGVGIPPRTGPRRTKEENYHYHYHNPHGYGYSYDDGDGDDAFYDHDPDPRANPAPPTGYAGGRAATLGISPLRGWGGYRPLPPTDSALLFYLFATYLSAPEWDFRGETVRSGAGAGAGPLLPLHVGTLPWGGHEPPSRPYSALLAGRRAPRRGGGLAHAVVFDPEWDPPQFQLVVGGVTQLVLGGYAGLLRALVLWCWWGRYRLGGGALGGVPGLAEVFARGEASVYWGR